jgi:hypothetical protein
MSSPHTVQFDLFGAIPFNRITDPGDGKIIYADRQIGSLKLVSAGAETRTLASPDREGVLLLIQGSVIGGTITMTVTGTYNGSDSSIAFTAIAQWVMLMSIESAAGDPGTFQWRVLNCAGVTGPSQNVSGGTLVADSLNVGSVTATAAVIAAASIPSIKATSASIPNLVVGTTISAASILATNLSVATQATIPNILCSSNLSVASVLATNISVGTAMSAASILATNLSVGTQATIPNIVCTSNLSVASVLATNLSVATGITTPSLKVGTGSMIIGNSVPNVSGGTAAVASQATVINGPMAIISVGTSTNNYFKLPAPAMGLQANVINLGGSTAGLVGAAGESIASATSVALATANATDSALNLFSDGTNWWKKSL